MFNMLFNEMIIVFANRRIDAFVGNQAAPVDGILNIRPPSTLL
jgi:hypothetical protein